MKRGKSLNSELQSLSLKNSAMNFFFYISFGEQDYISIGYIGFEVHISTFLLLILLTIIVSLGS